MKVLVIDDERAFAEVLSELLRDDGHVVSAAFDGHQALAALGRGHALPDVLLCDVMLPGLRGDQLAFELRQRYPAHHLPIVLMSASADPRVRLRDVWFMAKPLDFGELLEFLQRLDGRRRRAASSAA